MDLEQFHVKTSGSKMGEINLIDLHQCTKVLCSLQHGILPRPP